MDANLPTTWVEALQDARLGRFKGVWAMFALGSIDNIVDTTMWGAEQFEKNGSHN
jgi:hypothetical protein